MVSTVSGRICGNPVPLISGLSVNVEIRGGKSPWGHGSTVCRGKHAGKIPQTFESLAARPALQQFLDEHGARDSYADLGRLLSETEVNELPSGLTEEKALIADTFRRFADEVVAPLAGVIHREDRDIPDEIIQSAARMGCFGTCIPERFGGLQPDEQPDSLGMIVVTEELSRGSLGAAGSLITRPEIAARLARRGHRVTEIRLASATGCG